MIAEGIGAFGLAKSDLESEIQPLKTVRQIGSHRFCLSGLFYIWITVKLEFRPLEIFFEFLVLVLA